MKKIHLLLAILFLQCSSILAQSNYTAEIPCINNFTNDIYPEDAPIRLAAYDYASIVAIPYEGATSGTAATVRDLINGALSDQLIRFVECIHISGLNTANPAVSKGSIYFRVEPLSEDPYYFYPRVLQFSLLSNGATAFIIQPTPDYPIEDMMKFGLDYTSAGMNTYFELTGPYLPSQFTYKIRRIGAGHRPYQWDEIATIPANTYFDPESIPSAIVAVNSSLLQEGDYVIVNEDFGIAASNVVSITSIERPDYEWLTRPGEISQERSYMLNKNGEIYSMTAYVPLDSDISVLRTILNTSKYTVVSSQSSLTFRLVNEVRRVNDIALTFEVQCPPNTGSTTAVLTTGFSDRILSGIPNRFIQPGGGHYEISVEMGENEIIIHHPVEGRMYCLWDGVWNDYAFDFEVASNSDIVFTIPTPWIYKIIEIDGSTETQIGKTMNINTPELFHYMPHLRYDSTVIEIGPDSYTKMVTFQKEIDFSLETLEYVLEMINYENRYGNNSPLTCEFVEMNQNTCTLLLKATRRTSSNSERDLSPFYSTGSDLVRVKIKAGAALQPYAITGSWNNAGHSSFNVSLNGSQDGVQYSLVKERLFPTTSVINQTLEVIRGSGAPITFKNITQKGVYKVVAQAADASLAMSSVVNMYDDADILVDKSNWIKTRKYRDASGSQYNENATHYDGLGREIQSVSVAAGGNGEDVIQVIEYDNMGRSDTKSYLPYTRSSLGFKMSAHGIVEQGVYYENKFTGDPDNTYPNSQKQYIYTSSSDEVIQRTPGKNSSENPFHTVVRSILWGEPIKKLTMADDNRSLRYVGDYAWNSITAKDSWQQLASGEESAITTEYKNSEGQVVATGVKLPGGEVRLTYYVYDQLGRQRYVIPHIALVAPNSQIPSTGDYTPEQLHKYCYYTEYDKFGNVVEQHVPGAEPVYNIYDKRNRLVMSQTGNQRAEGENDWSYVKYDIYGRTVITGICTGGTYESHKAAISVQSVWGESAGGDFHGYTNVCYPTNVDPNQVLNVTYYDHYDWQTDSNYAFRSADALGGMKSDAIIGLSTGSKTKVLDGQASTPQWLTSVVYYDNQYRSIQMVTGLYPSGIEVTSNTYDFTGQVTQTRVKQIIGAQTYSYDKWFNFDSRGRLLNVEQQIAGDTGNGRVRIAEYAYDDMGAVTQKKLHNGIETTHYEYRLTGQQMAAYSPSFSYKLGFDRPADGNLSSRADGNLASMVWGTGSTLDNGYQYTYSKMGELTATSYYQKSGASWASQGSKYAENGIEYDLNGNITKMKRYDASSGVLHDLQYQYEHATNGNALSSVNNGTPFAYDAEGNLTTDGMTGVKIAYNVLNLPEKVYKDGVSEEIRYIYAANGTKLATVATGSSTYFRSVMVYAAQNDGAEQLLYMLHPEGLVTQEGSSFAYKYMKTDHTGSTRKLLAARKVGSTWAMQEEQSTNYYAFGLAWDALNNLHLNKYLYGGKEYQDATLGGSMLGLYDFHARYYNPVLGRWFNMDPALQLANPYLYGGNSPMMFTDPDGKVWWLIPVIVAGVYAIGNTVAHAIRGDIDNFGDFSKYFLQGAITGFALGCLWQFAPMLPWLGETLQTVLTIYAYTQVITGAAGMVGGLINDGWDGLGRGAQLFLGNFYLDENSFWGGMWQGFTRHTWEIVQTSFGQLYSHSRNTFNGVDRVDFLGGATFATNENSKNHNGITFGPFINMNIRGGITGNFDTYATSVDPMYMHEYGHTIDSRRFGPLYLPLPGLCSGISAAGSDQIPGNINGLWEHDVYWTETRANRLAEKYFRKHYGVNWSGYPFNKYPLRY